MEVLKRGTKNQVTCGGCGSVLRYNQSDLQLVHAPVQVGHHEIECMPEAEDHYRAVVQCLECRKSVTVNASRAEKRALLPKGPTGPHEM